MMFQGSKYLKGENSKAAAPVSVRHGMKTSATMAEEAILEGE